MEQKLLKAKAHGQKIGRNRQRQSKPKKGRNWLNKGEDQLTAQGNQKKIIVAQTTIKWHKHNAVATCDLQVVSCELRCELCGKFGVQNF